MDSSTVGNVQKEEAEVHHGGPGVVVVEEVQQQQAQESSFKLKKLLIETKVKFNRSLNKENIMIFKAKFQFI